MAPSARVQAAFRAMKDIGISEQKTKPVLKKLLHAYEKNWKVIEEENYRLLADAIFEDEDTGTSGNEKILETVDASQQGTALENEARNQEEPERPLKRLRRGQAASTGGQPTTGAGVSMLLKEPKPEPIDGAHDCSTISGLETPIQKNKGKEPIPPQSLALPSQSEPSKPHGRASQALCLKEPDKESGAVLASKSKEHVTNALIKPKDEPYTEDMPPLEAPLSMSCPESLRLPESGPTNANNSSFSQDCAHPSRSECVDGIRKKARVPSSAIEEARNIKGTNSAGKSPFNLEIATSSLGEVKISLSYDSVLERPDTHLPSLDEVIKYMEDKCLGSYKVVDPSFSVIKLMRDFCECFLEVATKSSSASPERSANLESAFDTLKNPSPPLAIYNNGCEGSPNMLSSSIIKSAIANRSDNVAEASVSASIQSQSQDCGTLCLVADKEFVDGGSVKKDANGVQGANAQSLVVVEQQQLDLDELRCIYDTADITRGEERVKVSLLVESNSGSLPSFYYMPHNVVYCNAHVKFFLARIGDKDFCPACYGDCLSSSSHCVCLCTNGRGLAYTSEGLVKKEFLEEYISVVRNPQKHHLSQCSICPLEKCKSEDLLEPCKGHFRRKFIKECWSKCGCAKICANRVVQRGISCNLQVFWTAEGKGWGVRTLDKLPKGAFVCEYVGEILTIFELHQRSVERKSKEKHSYAMILDADWGSGDLQDNQTLCLDSTLYGNVARFINHRCFDANLVEIPVQIETPDRHYYHVAFFTTREVNALEELTWDYGIDFDDQDNLFKTFNCLCGSKFCRDMKRSNRSRLISSVH